MNARALGLTITLLAAGLGGIAAGQRFFGEAPPSPIAATILTHPRQLAEFALTDQDGQPFTRRQLDGAWSILFFGFTHCPDVCPATMAKLAAAEKALIDLPPTERPRIVMVSVDPARDSVERLAGYVRYFSGSFTGVTGESSALEPLVESLGVAYALTPDGESGYTVDHTAALFVIDAQARLAAVLTPPFDSRQIASSFRAVVARAVAGAR